MVHDVLDSSEGRPSERSSNPKPLHTYQILTKRAGRMRSWVSRWGDRGQRAAWIESAAERGWCDAEDVQHAPWMPSVLPNAWLRVSVESQRWARVRLPELARTPAAVRFASCEPLLGELDLKPWLGFGLDWVIAGGESGPGARPMHPQWARVLRDQCVAADVPFFFKQWGAHLPVPVEDDPEFAGSRSFANPRHGGRSAAVVRGRGSENRGLRPMRAGDRNGVGLMLDDDTIAVRVGKKQAGRQLDGRTWDEFPVTSRA